MAEDNEVLFSGGFRQNRARLVPGTDRRIGGRGLSRSLGSEAPIPFDKTPTALSGSAARAPTSQRTSAETADFAREAKRIATKRGLTGAQRRAQLGAAETAFELQRAGISEDDPRAQEVLGLSRGATRRGLSGLQRRIQTSAAGTLLSDLTKGSKNEDTQLTFNERLDKALGI